MFKCEKCGNNNTVKYSDSNITRGPHSVCQHCGFIKKEIKVAVKTK